MLVGVGQGGAVGFGVYIQSGEWGAQISAPGNCPAPALGGGACTCPNRPPLPAPPLCLLHSCPLLHLLLRCQRRPRMVDQHVGFAPR